MTDQDRKPLSQERVPLQRSTRDQLEADNVTSADYQRALERLRNFLELDIGEIRTLEQLLGNAFLVDSALRTVLLAKGKVQSGFFAKRISTGYIIDAVVRETEHLYVSSDVLNTHVSSDTIVNGESESSNYVVTIPSSTYFELITNPHGHVLGIFAMDFRGSESVSYYPNEESANSLVWQGYARILQEAVRDLISALPEPTETPVRLVADED